MSDEAFNTMCWAILIAVFFAFCIASSIAEDDECEARGGHVITKWAYKSAVKLCVSADGRVLE